MGLRILPPKYLVRSAYKNRPAFRTGKMTGRRGNGSKADAIRDFSGNFRPCKRSLKGETWTTPYAPIEFGLVFEVNFLWHGREKFPLRFTSYG
ncbi:hypothetical protein TNCV_2416041 [Trichonephila clavipes]|nr:hypothetical protein TNCV_2416041 [Trichonephila clavipes]